MRRPQTLPRMGLAAFLIPISVFMLGCPLIDGGTGGTGTGTGGIFNLPPTVVLTTDITRGVAPLTVRFSSAGSTDDGVIVERRWQFGDGATSAEIAPVHTYAERGVYTAVLTLVDEDGAQASRSIEITVTEAPVPVIEASATSAEEAPATITFDGSASFDPDAEEGDELRFRWDFGDGAFENEAVVDHTFTRAGTFRVQLTVTDANGISASDTRLIDIGIRRPTIELRSPRSGIGQIVCSVESPLWVLTVFNVEPTVPYRLAAGLDGDGDVCDALATLLDPATGEQLDVFTGHAGPVRGADFSPDGALLVTAGDDGAVRFYDAITGVFLRQYAGAFGALHDVAFAPDGIVVAIGAADGTVALVDVATAQVTRTFVGHTATVRSVDVSPGSEQVLSGDADGVAILWDVAGGTEIRRFTHAQGGAPQAVHDVLFNPAAPTQIATASDDSAARLWSAVDGSVVQQFAPVFSNGTQIAGHTGPVRALAFPPDGLQLATGGDDGTVRLWNTDSGMEARVITNDGAGVTSLGFTRDGLRLATGAADGAVRVWDLAAGTVLWRAQPCTSAISSLDFDSADARLLAAVAAENDIQLDTIPPQGNDLDLNLPTGLDLTGVPTGRQYRLWVEIDTDRTAPSRTYSDASVYVAAPFGTTIPDPNDPGAAPIPLGENDDVIICASPAKSPPPRQVVDLGPLATGDRVHIALLSLPGYRDEYVQDGFSIIMLDGEQRLYAWFQNGLSQLAATNKLLIGHDSAHHYLVLDNEGGSQPAPSLHVRVERGFAADSQPRGQTIYLNFDGSGVPISVLDALIPFLVEPFDIAGADNEAVKNAIENQLSVAFAAYDVTIRRSDDGQPAPTDPAKIIYFDTTEAMLNDGFLGFLTGKDLFQFGLPSFFSPRNQTLSGHAVIDTTSLLDEYSPGTDDEIGIVLGNAAAHQVGLLSGLRQDTGTGIMAVDGPLDDPGLTFSLPAPPPDLTGFGRIGAIGTQDAHQMLMEIYGF